MVKIKNKKPAIKKEISLESILWNCRNSVRAPIGGNEENRDSVMGIVF